MKRTKIIATVGPACSSEKMMESFIKAGVNVFRLNFSHGNHEKHKEYFQTIKKVRDRMGKHIAVLADLQGPKIRVGEIEMELKRGKTVVLNCGQAEQGEIPVQYRNLYKDIKKNERLLLDDGKLELRAEKILDKRIYAKVVVGGLLTSNKGINLPESSISAEAISLKDKKDAQFALSLGVDFLALSFVKSGSDIINLRKIIKSSRNRETRIIAKIERHEALVNIDDIINEADGIMVARGDLGIEIASQKVPIIQKQIIRRCLMVGKPCIVATQMLESMINHPHSTRAETSDIANAILDGADVTMLSGETSVGKYPLNAVRAMNEVALDTEKWMKEDHIIIGRRIQRDKTKIPEAIAMASVEITKEVGAKYIIAATASGNNARAICKYRPQAKIIGVTANEKIARQLSLSWGIEPLIMHYDSNRHLTNLINKWLRDKKLAQKGDKITVVSGLIHGKIGGTSLIRVHEIE